MVKSLLAIWVQSLGQEDPLEKGKATHSSILAWRISGTEEPGRLQPMDCKESDMTEQLTQTHRHTDTQTHSHTDTDIHRHTHTHTPGGKGL